MTGAREGLAIGTVAGSQRTLLTTATSFDEMSQSSAQHSSLLSPDCSLAPTITHQQRLAAQSKCYCRGSEKTASAGEQRVHAGAISGGHQLRNACVEIIFPHDLIMPPYALPLAAVLLT